MNKIAIVIVAAGGSSRMKKPKQLLPFGKTTLLGNAIAQATATGADEVIVVLGANFEKIKPTIADTELTIVENKDWKKGIGSSIASGVSHIQDVKGYEAVLLILTDQPLIDSTYLDHMIKIFREDPSKIIATKYPKSSGVPALFPKKYLEELSSLKEDSGAKYLLNKDRPVVVLDAGKKILDIDTPEEYEQIRKD